MTDPVAKRAIVREVIKMQGGLFGDVKHIEGAVWEKRLDLGPGYRLYYLRRGSVLFLLLWGGTKRHQKADIEKAMLLAAGL